MLNPQDRVCGVVYRRPQNISPRLFEIHAHGADIPSERFLITQTPDVAQIDIFTQVFLYFYIQLHYVNE